MGAQVVDQWVARPDPDEPGTDQLVVLPTDEAIPPRFRRTEEEHVGIEPRAQRLAEDLIAEPVREQGHTLRLAMPDHLVEAEDLPSISDFNAFGYSLHRIVDEETDMAARRGGRGEAESLEGGQGGADPEGVEPIRSRVSKARMEPERVAWWVAKPAAMPGKKSIDSSGSSQNSSSSSAVMHIGRMPSP